MKLSIMVLKQPEMKIFLWTGKLPLETSQSANSVRKV